MAQELRLNDLGDVLDELYEARRKWYNIGLKLKVPVDVLDNIDPNDGLREVLKNWLKSTCSKTWKVLIDALNAPSVGEHALAENLGEKYMPAPPQEGAAAQGDANESRL